MSMLDTSIESVSIKETFQVHQSVQHGTITSSVLDRINSTWYKMVSENIIG